MPTVEELRTWLYYASSLSTCSGKMILKVRLKPNATKLLGTTNSELTFWQDLCLIKCVSPAVYTRLRVKRPLMSVMHRYATPRRDRAAPCRRPQTRAF